jgi:hypothetical protein
MRITDNIMNILQTNAKGAGVTTAITMLALELDKLEAVIR